MDIVCLNLIIAQRLKVNITASSIQGASGIEEQDTLIGGLGNDVFQGNGGSDTINCGTDDDVNCFRLYI